MNTYVITFASVGIRDGWIEVTAKSEDIVRAWADKEYRRWSTTHPIEAFDSPSFFPLGCLGRTTLHFEEASHV
jgi:hypothetical protein